MVDDLDILPVNVINQNCAKFVLAGEELLAYALSRIYAQETRIRALEGQHDGMFTLLICSLTIDKENIFSV